VGDVGEGEGLGEGRLDRRLAAGEALAEESEIEDVGEFGVGGDEFFGIGAGHGGVVLMDAVDGDAVGGGASGLGEGGAPLEVSRVEQASPVDRADDDGGAGPEEHEADRFEFVINDGDVGDPATAAAMPHGGGDVELEGGDLERRVGDGGGGGVAQDQVDGGEGGEESREEVATGEGHGDRS
jgi:hypothetical protein